MADLVSIITPSYNSERFVEEAVRSVRNQSYSDWELLITDDCSTDRTVDVVREMERQDPRVRLGSTDTNSGPGVARNLSISRARGRFMAFLDSDDIWFDFHLNNSIEAMRDIGTPFVFSSYERRNEALDPLLEDFIVPDRVSYNDVLKSNPISCLTAVIDVSILGKKLMPSIRSRQDVALWLSYLKVTPYAYGIKESHAIYRIREGSVSRSKSKMVRSQWALYREIEGLGLVNSTYNILSWMYFGYKKYRR